MISPLCHAAIPNHDKLKEFYVAASGFDGRGRNTDKPEEDQRYWATVLDTALRMTRRAGAEGEGLRLLEREDGRPFHRQRRPAQARGATCRWCTRRTATAGWRGWRSSSARNRPTIERVLQWCDYYKADPKMRSAFFAKQSKPFLAGMDDNGSRWP